MKRVKSKMFKTIPASPRNAGLKSCSMPTPSPLRDGENLHGAKRGRVGQVRRGKIVIPIQDQVQLGIEANVQL